MHKGSDKVGEEYHVASAVEACHHTVLDCYRMDKAVDVNSLMPDIARLLRRTYLQLILHSLDAQIVREHYILRYLYKMKPRYTVHSYFDDLNLQYQNQLISVLLAHLR